MIRRSVRRLRGAGPGGLARTGRLGVGAVVTAMTLSGCAAHQLAVPIGSRTPAPDAGPIWQDVTRACRAVRVYSSTVRLSGRRDGERIPAGFAVATGFDDSGRLRLEGRMLGRLIFTLAGATDHAVLVLHREREYVEDRADRLLEALLGVPLEPAGLLALLTGCGTFSTDVTDAARLGHMLEVVTADARVYLEQSEGGWRPRLALTAGAQVDFRARSGGWPSEVRVWSNAGRAPVVELRVRVDTVEINTFTFGDATFRLDVPADATLVSLDALRRAIRDGGR